MERLTPGILRSLAFNLLGGMCIYHNSYAEAADLLKHAVEDAKSNPAVLLRTLLMLSFAQGTAGVYDEALRNARQAEAIADELGIPVMMSQAIATRVMISCICGHGVDEPALQRALELDDISVDVPIVLRAGATAGRPHAGLERAIGEGT
jgi:hypothetical protein